MAPVTFSQIVTTNEASAATSRISDVSPTSFSVMVQEEEGNDNLHAVEEVDWIAISQGLGPSGFALASGDSLTHETTRFDFFGQFLDAEERPALFAAMQTFDGADPAVLRYTSLDRMGAELFVQEEQSADLEFLHTTEVVGIAALDEGLIFA